LCQFQDKYGVISTNLQILHKNESAPRDRFTQPTPAPIGSHLCCSIRGYELDGMNLTVKAIYEQGVLRLAEPLPVVEGARVDVTILLDAAIAPKS
jgi:hypothetical protein